MSDYWSERKCMRRLIFHSGMWLLQTSIPRLSRRSDSPSRALHIAPSCSARRRKVVVQRRNCGLDMDLWREPNGSMQDDGGVCTATVGPTDLLRRSAVRPELLAEWPEVGLVSRRTTPMATEISAICRSTLGRRAAGRSFRCPNRAKAGGDWPLPWGTPR